MKILLKTDWLISSYLNENKPSMKIYIKKYIFFLIYFAEIRY